MANGHGLLCYPAGLAWAGHKFMQSGPRGTRGEQGRGGESREVWLLGGTAGMGEWSRVCSMYMGKALAG